MNKLPAESRAQVIGMMAEGVSIRAICRLTGVSKNTVAKLLVDAGTACAEYQDRTLRNLPCKKLQCDEIWSFVGAKKKNVPADKQEEYGDVWTWTAIDADSKLIISYLVGRRTTPNAERLSPSHARPLSMRHSNRPDERFETSFAT